MHRPDICTELAVLWVRVMVNSPFGFAFNGRCSVLLQIQNCWRCKTNVHRVLGSVPSKAIPLLFSWKPINKVHQGQSEWALSFIIFQSAARCQPSFTASSIKDPVFLTQKQLFCPPGMAVRILYKWIHSECFQEELCVTRFLSLTCSIQLSFLPPITYLDNLWIVSEFWINLAKPARPASLAVGVWECCLRMYPNTHIVSAFFHQSNPLPFGLRSPSNSLKSTYRECWLLFAALLHLENLSLHFLRCAFLQLQLRGVVVSRRVSPTGKTYTLRWVITALWKLSFSWPWDYKIGVV